MSDWTNIALKFSNVVFCNVQLLAGNKTAIPKYWMNFHDKLIDLMIWDKEHAQPSAAQRVLNSVFEMIFIFTDEQLKILKNPNQFYEVKDGNVKNISELFYRDCANQLDSVTGQKTEFFENLNEEEKLDLVSSKEYNKIVDEFKKNIADTLPPDTNNSAVLSDPKYLKNYYLDFYGNNVKSDLIDYYSAYYTNINKENPKECIPVETLVGKPNFIIPDQYNIVKKKILE
jgi:hypothetical protein